MKIKLLQELNPSQRTLKTISSTHPYKIQITSGKINVLDFIIAINSFISS